MTLEQKRPGGLGLPLSLRFEPKRDSDPCLPEFERHRSEVRT